MRMGRQEERQVRSWQIRGDVVQPEKEGGRGYGYGRGKRNPVQQGSDPVVGNMVGLPPQAQGLLASEDKERKKHISKATTKASRTVGLDVWQLLESHDDLRAVAMYVTEL
jgi:hypothetical protein